MNIEEYQVISGEKPQERNRAERRMYEKARQRGWVVEEYAWTEKALNSVELTLATAIVKTMEKGKNHYIHPSPNTMIGLQKRFYNRTISRPTYFRNMKHLQDMGFIGRRRRYKKNNDGQPRRLPSLITFTLQGARYLANMGIAYARKIAEQIIQWLKMGNKQSPQRTEVIYARAETFIPPTEINYGGVDTGKEAIRKIIEMLEAK